MNKCVYELGDLSNGRAALYKCISEGNTPSHRQSVNPTDHFPLRQLITLGLAGQLGLGLDLVVVTSTPPQYSCLPLLMLMLLIPLILSVLLHLANHAFPLYNAPCPAHSEL